jgi:hypothetical protein
VTAVKKKKSLEDAIAVIDAYLGAEGLSIVRDLREILKNKTEDSRARVAAGTKLLDYIKPPKGFQLNLHSKTEVHSSLNLPKAPIEMGPVENPRAIARAAVQKILPEPARDPGFLGRSEVGSSQQLEPERVTALTLPARTKDPRSPDLPPPPSSVRPFEPDK